MASMGDLISYATSQSEYSNLLSSDLFGIISVKNYGAEGDGTTDDTTAINTAIAALSSNSGGFLYFPTGIYYISSEIELDDDISVICADNVKFIDTAYRTSPHRFFTATSKTNVHFYGGYFYGNNTDYARYTDSAFADESDGFSNGCCLYFESVTNGSIRNVKTKYVWESIVMKTCTDCMIEDCETDHYDGTNTETGIFLAGCTNTHVNRCHVINGGDGALFIYNGTHCSIKNSHLENTGSHYNAGSGIESCEHCVLENVRVYGAFAGFILAESVRHGVVKNCLAENCHVGYMVSPYGIGVAGGDVIIDGCSSIKHQTIGAISYPVCGYYIQYSGVSTNYMTRRIKIVNSYFGRSNAGIGIIADVPAGVLSDQIIVSNNVFEAAGYYNIDGVTYNTSADILNFTGVREAVISGNTFAIQTTSNFPSPQIDFIRCYNSIFSNNIVLVGGDNIQVNVDSDCIRMKINNNIFTGSKTGGYLVLQIAGTLHQINNNSFAGTGTIMSLTNLTKSMICNNNAPDASSDAEFITSLATTTTTTIKHNNGYSVESDEINGTVAWDPGNLVDGAGETKSLTVTGAALGDFVLVAAPYDLQDMICTAYVQATDTVEIRLQNETGGDKDLGSGTWKVKVIKT